LNRINPRYLRRQTRLLAGLLSVALAGNHMAVAADAQSSSPNATPANAPPATTQPERQVDPIFAEFTAWTQRYLEADAAARAALEADGAALAQRRREALAKLIESDPKQALQLTVPLQVRGQLPASVSQQLEERVSGRGEFMVLIFDFIDPNTGERSSKIQRSATIKGKAYNAHVYGRRRGLSSKVSIPLHGIAIERALAVHESPVRMLEPGEVPDPAAPVGNPDKRCPICNAAEATNIIVDVGGTIYYFDQAEHLQKFVAAIVAKEAVVDPRSSGP
ncbi:MAG: hypothetical protein M3347_00820, partial [Armatimonadota bacterium]|nr:hypothetical protein [Armatimonadota bacterium]